MRIILVDAEAERRSIVEIRRSVVDMAGTEVLRILGIVVLVPEDKVEEVALVHIVLAAVAPMYRVVVLVVVQMLIAVVVQMLVAVVVQMLIAVVVQMLIAVLEQRMGLVVHPEAQTGQTLVGCWGFDQRVVVGLGMVESQQLVVAVAVVIGVVVVIVVADTVGKKQVDKVVAVVVVVVVVVVVGDKLPQHEEVVR